MDTVAFGILIALLVPLFGTTLGSSLVFFMKRQMKEKFQKALLGFAAGVMIAASVWSLLIPAIEMSEAQGVPPWLPPVVGFLAGMAALLVLDSLLPHLHIDASKPEGLKSGFKKSTMLFLALTIHNLPEGMAVGVVLAGFLSGEGVITLAGLAALAVGIAIQNVPEGAVVSMPLMTSGLSRGKAFGLGFTSGAVEPLGVLLMLALTPVVSTILPYVLAFAAGAMIYVVVEELIPETQSGEHTNAGTIGVALGFALMMVLDIALG